MPKRLSTYFGKGKAQELKEIVAALGADTVVADTELAPSQRRALEDVVKVKVLDRTAVILDIFSQHAKSREGKAQVELAQLEYLLPRLRGWGESMSRQAGGQAAGGVGMGSRGPGETKIVIQTSADLAVNNDFVARGYLIIRTAHELGCDTFVHISFPRHMSYETMSRRVAIMRATCEELGMKFVLETAPDPTSDVGVAGAQQYILEKVPAWIETYGKNAAFFCTNDAHTEPLLKQLLAYGGYFIEADLPSPLMGYPGALGIDLSAEAGNFSAILKKVEASVVAKGGAGRFGTWAYSYGYTSTAGLGQHAINVLKGESELLKLSDLMKAYGKYTAGAKWNGSFYTDVNTGVRARNHVLIYQDTYMMGKGYMGNADLVVPEKYFSIK